LAGRFHPADPLSRHVRAVSASAFAYDTFHETGLASVMTTGKKDQMIAFWSERARQYGHDPRANTNDIWLRDIEIACVVAALQERPVRSAMDFGCANGYSTIRIAGANRQVQFLGIDLNPAMVRLAADAASRESLPNLTFRAADVVAEEMTERFDFVYAIRVFQNMESFAAQTAAFDRLCDLLNPQGSLLYIESYADGYARLNDDRCRMDLPPLPIHPHLTLLTDEFDRHAARRLTLVRRQSLSSSYYLVTRLLYASIAKMNGEAIDYNHPIHQVGAMLPQIGEYGPQRACLYRKP
jgi:predicted O-methyltransferase YrrM